MRLLTLLLPTLLVMHWLCACSGEYGNDDPPVLVVEGWIDDGGFPEVYVTRTANVTEEYQDISDLSKYLERWAKVTISDGEKEEVLIGRLNKRRTPPFYYTTSYMRGQKGKTYRLHAETSDGLFADAVTTMPHLSVAIDSFWVTSVAMSDTLFQLHAHLDLNACTGEYYKVFVQTDSLMQSTLSSMLGVFSVEMTEDGSFVINKGRSNLDKDYVSSFSVNDNVHVRIVALNDEQYQFWRSFEDMVFLSRNPFFPVSENMPSNMSTGVGYWFAYTSRNYVVSIRKMVERQHITIPPAE